MKRRMAYVLLSFWISLILITIPSCVLNPIPEYEHPLPNGYEPGPSEPQEIPYQGGQLTVSIPKPDSLNPLLTQSKDIVSFLNLIFEGLVEYDDQLHIKANLAERWEISQGGRIYYFYIRKGVKWHNGDEFTGQDVVFTLSTLMHDEMNSFYKEGRTVHNNIDEFGLRNGDPYVVYIKLKTPDNSILDFFTFPILPQSIYKSFEHMISINEDDNILPIGTGPFEIETWDYEDNNEICLTRNEDWWGDKPYIDSILVKIYQDSEQAKEAFKNGQLDLIDINMMYTNPYVDSQEVVSYKYLTQNYDFIGFNLDHPILSDSRVRRAIAYALNRKEIIVKVYLNNAEAVDVPIPSDSWLYDSYSRIYDYQPEKAVTLLEQAGWNDSDDDGIRDCIVNGQKIDLRFRLITNSENSFRKDALSIIKNQLKQVGIAIDTEVYSIKEIKDNYLFNRDFDAVLIGYYLGLHPDLRFIFHSDYIESEFNNFMGYRNEELDELLNKASAAIEDQPMKDLYKKIQRHIVTQLPIVSLYFQTGSLIANKRVKGIKTPREMNIYNNIENWYIETVSK